MIHFSVKIGLNIHISCERVVAEEASQKSTIVNAIKIIFHRQEIALFLHAE
jgi:hypothetical protein